MSQASKSSNELTGTVCLESELTHSDSFYRFNVFAWNNRNSSCVYTVGRHERSSDCLDTVFSVFTFIKNNGCL